MQYIYNLILDYFSSLIMVCKLMTGNKVTQAEEWGYDILKGWEKEKIKTSNTRHDGKITIIDFHK